MDSRCPFSLLTLHLFLNRLIFLPVARFIQLVLVFGHSLIKCLILFATIIDWTLVKITNVLVPSLQNV